MPTIDVTTYDKARAHPYVPAKFPQGYDPRPTGHVPGSIVVHSTEGAIGQSFNSAAVYLRDSVNVSSHYLVGRNGEIARILEPSWRAWHAGNILTEYAAYGNSNSIGIECLHKDGENWPDAQMQSLTWLVERSLVAYSIPPTMVETHEQIAAPPGRKHDPTNWPRPDFIRWRDGLLRPDDRWSQWGDAYPLPPEQRGWAIPQFWFVHADELGAARSYEMYLDDVTSAQTFDGGLVMYEQVPDRASMLKRMLPLGVPQ